jgi:hypothetical protein
MYGDLSYDESPYYITEYEVHDQLHSLRNYDHSCKGSG